MYMHAYTYLAFKELTRGLFNTLVWDRGSYICFRVYDWSFEKQRFDRRVKYSALYYMYGHTTIVKNPILIRRKKTDPSANSPSFPTFPTFPEFPHSL